MQITTDSQKPLELRPDKSWQSFEQFRTEGAKGLKEIKEGAIATLITKTGQYRIIEEHDFQQLYGLARDVARIRQGLRLIIPAVRAIQKHPDPENIELLLQIVAYSQFSELPTRDNFEPLVPENIFSYEDDEVTINPTEIDRPLDATCGDSPFNL